MPGLGEPCFAWIEKKFAQLARNKWVALATIGAATIVARLALLPWISVPQPKVHDEFSYLLAADTFAHGRLVNPPHPMWIFFDTFHVIQHPTYASIYPPAQGAVLAIGQLLGQPWIGVLLSTAAMCLAMTWMLQGWMEPEWALLGGMLVLLRFGVFSYWMNSYWGGSVAATGAALVMGALPRVLKIQRTRDALVFGLGAAILATSRPVEGFIFCIPLGVALVWQTLRQEPPAQRAWSKGILLPLAAVLACIVGFVAYYNWRVTGNPVVFPHFIEQQTEITTPVFLWQHDKPPLTYANRQFDAFYNGWMRGLSQKSSWDKSVEFWQFFLMGPALSTPLLLTLPWLLRDRQMRLLLLQFGLCCIGLLSVVWFYPHYAAPVMATLIVLVMEALRRMSRWQWLGRPIGLGLVREVVLFCMLIRLVYLVNMLMAPWPSLSHYWLIAGQWNRTHFPLALATVPALVLVRLLSLRSVHSPERRLGGFSSWEFALLILFMLQVSIRQKNFHSTDFLLDSDGGASPRVPAEKYLSTMPGEHLVLVRYLPNHNVNYECVYNAADIDHAKTVWAREIPGMDLSPLLTYFRNRDVWVVEPDQAPPRLYPYAPNSSSP
jgi:hypothetical protein